MKKTQKRVVADWVESFCLHPDDYDHLADRLLESSTPWSNEEVALSLLIFKLMQEERSQGKTQRGNGNVEIYRPDKGYEPGQALRFPVLEDIEGKVISVRKGFNWTDGEFRVIVVSCDDNCTREFASMLPKHALSTDDLGLSGIEGQTVDEFARFLLREHGTHLWGQIKKDLISRGEIVCLAGYWFPRDLLVEISSGHLNLVEAILDVSAGGPLTPEEILQQLGVRADGDRQLMIFSLNYALQQDQRFDEVGPSGSVLWFLRSMEPTEIIFPPERLRCQPVVPDVHLLSPDLEQLALHLHDEFSPENESYGAEGPVEMVLSYPPRCTGTLPLGANTAHIFPEAQISPRIKITIRDALSGDQLPGWVVQHERFVSGLGPLYEKYEVPAGARITLLPCAASSEVLVQIDLRKSVREWVLTASAVDDKLRFRMSKRLVGVHYAEEQIIAVDDVEDVEAVWERLHKNRVALEHTVLEVFRELVQLTPQGAVHAKTLYSAVNVARRTPPEPVFGELLKRSYYRHVGEAYWTHDSDSEDRYTD